MRAAKIISRTFVPRKQIIITRTTFSKVVENQKLIRDDEENEWLTKMAHEHAAPSKIPILPVGGSKRKDDGFGNVIIQVDSKPINSKDDSAENDYLTEQSIRHATNNPPK